MSHFHSCSLIQTATSIYLNQMILMTLSLTASLIGCFLAAVVTCCRTCCLEQVRSMFILSYYCEYVCTMFSNVCTCTCIFNEWLWIYFHRYCSHSFFSQDVFLIAYYVYYIVTSILFIYRVSISFFKHVLHITQCVRLEKLVFPQFRLSPLVSRHDDTFPH